MVAATFTQGTVDVAARMARVRKLAWLLDAQFVVPGTKFRFGLNGLLGLAPAVGDMLMGAISLYIVYEAKQMGAPAALIGRMMVNVFVEVLGGSVPLLGDLFDVAFKANLRNVALLEEWVRTR